MPLRAIFRVSLSCCIFHIAVQAAQAPFGGTPWGIPGTIEAENFDEGGEGVSYHDTTATNEGGAYRNTAVDIYPASDASGGYYVNLVQSEWLEFTVNVQETAFYDLFARVLLNANGGQQFHLSMDDRDVTQPVTKPGIGGPPAWGEALAQGVVLHAGQHVLRLYLTHVIYPQFNETVGFDNLRFVRSSVVPAQVVSGSGQPGFADGLPALAQFSTNITGLDVDLAGNIYVADSGNFRVRKVGPDGSVKTLAGNGTDGAADGAGSQAQFSLLRGVAVDDTGICYVTDGNNGEQLNKIRKIAADGQTSTIYSEARGSIDFYSIVLNRALEPHFIRVVHGYLTTPSAWTISRLSGTGTRTDLATAFGTGAAGTILVWLSAGHSPDLYYLSWPYSFSSITAEVNQLDASGGKTNLYQARAINSATGPIRSLLADRSGNIYFGSGPNLNQLTPAVGLRTVYSNPGLSDKLAADINGNVYAFVNNRLIQVLTSESGLGLTAFTDGGGTVSVDPPIQVYVSNAMVQVTAAAQPGWTFMGWTNDISSTQTSLTLSMTDHVSLQAIFGVPLETKATNGTVLRDPDYGFYPYGTLVQLTARPDAGFEFSGWSDGVPNPIRLLEVTNLITLAPLFTALPKYTLTVSALGGTGGTVSRSPDQAEYFRDTPVIVTARPANGYVFQVWLDNVLENPRTVIMSSNTTLFAAFAQAQGTPPQITSAPQGRNALVGGQVTFTVAATGSSPLTYQWQFKGADLPGAVAPTLILSGVQTNHAGTYKIIVSNPAGTATAEALLNVFTPFKLETVSGQFDQTIHLMLSGDPGSRYRIERSEDLVGWQPVDVLTNSSGVVHFTDPVVIALKQRFYRALLLPGD